MKKTIAFALILALLFTAAAFAETDVPDFDQLAKLEWVFSSGVGGWSTELSIQPDGSFSGAYHDSEMGDATDDYPDGTVYGCAFSGQMTLAEQLDENSWKIRIDSLSIDGELGQETIDDGIRFVTDEPYGISEGDEMRLFLPGTPVDILSEDMRVWAHLLDPDAMPSELEDWFLYSEQNDSGFVGYSADGGIGLANPWVDMTEEELTQVAGLTLGVPEGAEDIVYRWLESERLAEMQFKLDGDEFCARVKPAALGEGELMDISGMYFAWENEESVTIRYCHGSIAQAKTGSEDWVELCLWYDAAPGLMYSLSVYTTEPDGLDLTAIAEMVFVPVQGDN